MSQPDSTDRTARHSDAHGFPREAMRDDLRLEVFERTEGRHKICGNRRHQRLLYDAGGGGVCKTASKPPCFSDSAIGPKIEVTAADNTDESDDGGLDSIPISMHGQKISSADTRPVTGIPRRRLR